MGKMDLKSDNFTCDSTCRFGGYVIDVPYSLEVPDYLRPLSGFLNGTVAHAGCRAASWLSVLPWPQSHETIAVDMFMPATDM